MNGHQLQQLLLPPLVPIQAQCTVSRLGGSRITTRPPQVPICLSIDVFNLALLRCTPCLAIARASHCNTPLVALMKPINIIVIALIIVIINGTLVAFDHCFSRTAVLSGWLCLVYRFSQPFCLPLSLARAGCLFFLDETSLFATLLPGIPPARLGQ